MKYIRASIGTFFLLTLNGIGLILYINYKGILKCLGYFNYIITAVIVYLIVLIYFESDFFKELGK